MLGRTIYEDTKRDIHDYARTYTRSLREEIEAQKTLHRSIQRAYIVARLYNADIIRTTYKNLREVGKNAVEHYDPLASEQLKAYVVNNALYTLTHSQYYGLTLPQRLRQSHLNLRGNIKRSGSVGVKLETRLQNIIRVFDSNYPFGAQKNWDVRLFLAEAVRMEHEIARQVADYKEEKLVRWTLSDTHTEEDQCDKLALTVDINVNKFIQKGHLGIQPEGVYFIKDIPLIPHPNCQCTLQFVSKAKKKRKIVPKRSKNLIQRIIDAIFGNK